MLTWEEVRDAFIDDGWDDDIAESMADKFMEAGDLATHKVLELVRAINQIPFA